MKDAAENQVQLCSFILKRFPLNSSACLPPAAPPIPPHAQGDDKKGGGTTQEEKAQLKLHTTDYTYRLWNLGILGRTYLESRDNYSPQFQNFWRQKFRDLVILQDPRQNFSPPVHLCQGLDPHNAQGALHFRKAVQWRRQAK